MTVTLSAIVTWAGLAAATATCLTLSSIDIRQHRLPNRIVAPFATGTALWLLLLGALDSDVTSAVAAIGWGLVIAAIALAINILTNGIGMGDVKLIAPVAATLTWLGPQPSIVAIAATGAASLATSAALLLRGRGLSHRLPLGPVITIGFIAGITAHGVGT